jgi:hypothetical protein
MGVLLGNTPYTLLLQINATKDMAPEIGISIKVINLGTRRNSICSIYRKIVKPKCLWAKRHQINVLFIYSCQFQNGARVFLSDVYHLQL